MSAASAKLPAEKSRFLPQFLRIAAINENRPATGGVAAIHVAPAVADHPALRQINAQFARGAQQHAGLRLAAIAIRQPFAGMITNLHAVNRQPAAHFGVNLFDRFLFQACRGRRPAGWSPRRAESRPLSSLTQASALPGRISNSPKFAGGYGLPSRSKARLMTPSRSRKTARRNF